MPLQLLPHLTWSVPCRFGPSESTIGARHKHKVLQGTCVARPNGRDKSLVGPRWGLKVHSIASLHLGDRRRSSIDEFEQSQPVNVYTKKTVQQATTIAPPHTRSTRGVFTRDEIDSCRFQGSNQCRANSQRIFPRPLETRQRQTDLDTISVSSDPR